MTPEERQYLMQARRLHLEIYDRLRELENVMAALEPAPKRRKAPTLKEMQDSIRTIWPDGRPRNKARK